MADVVAGRSGGESAAVTTDLKQGAIGLVGALMQAITGMGPIFAALFFTQEVVGIAGVTAPLAYLLGVIVVVMLGSTLVQFTKHMPSAGSYYTFVSRGLNGRLGFLTAWMNFVYMPVVQGPIMGFFGAVLSSELKANYNVNLPWLWWVAILVGAPMIALLAHFGIAISVRVMVITGLFEILLVWVLGICGMPLWVYVACFVYPGVSLALVRSFAEHRAEQEVGKRTAIVENARILGPLFLFNNLHAAHHLRGRLPWYQVPKFYRLNRAALIEGNGGLVYNSYFDVALRYLVTRHDKPIHPGWGQPAE